MPFFYYILQVTDDKQVRNDAWGVVNFQPNVFSNINNSTTNLLTTNNLKQVDDEHASSVTDDDDMRYVQYARHMASLWYCVSWTVHSYVNTNIMLFFCDYDTDLACVAKRLKLDISKYWSYIYYRDLWVKIYKLIHFP